MNSDCTQIRNLEIKTLNFAVDLIFRILTLFWGPTPHIAVTPPRTPVPQRILNPSSNQKLQRLRSEFEQRRTRVVYT